MSLTSSANEGRLTSASRAEVCGGPVINICFRARPLGDGPRHPLEPDVLKAQWFTREELRAFPREHLRHARAHARLEDWLAGKAFPLEVLRQSLVTL